MRELSAIELKAYLDTAAEPPLLLDVREPWEFERCRIDGSQLLPMGEVRAESDRLDPDRETIVICHHGIRSFSVARYLEKELGFSNVVNLAGGVAAWAREVDPAMATY